MKNYRCQICGRVGPMGGVLENHWGWLICRAELRAQCIRREDEIAQAREAQEAEGEIIWTRAA